MTSVSGLTFDECWRVKKEVEFEGETINFISLHHLRLNKKATGRDKDNLDLKNLPEQNTLLCVKWMGSTGETCK